MPRLEDEDRDYEPSFGAAIWLSAAAVVLCTGLHVVFNRSKLASFDAFLWIEGSILLACSIQPVDILLNKTWKERFFGDSLPLESMFFIPFMFHSGLALLASAALVGTFVK